MLKDAGLPELQPHLIQSTSIQPLLQQYEAALAELSRTVKVAWLEEGGKLTYWRVHWSKYSSSYKASVCRYVFRSKFYICIPTHSIHSYGKVLFLFFKSVIEAVHIKCKRSDQ